MNSGEHAAYQKPGILRRFFGLLAWTGFVALLSWLTFVYVGHAYAVPTGSMEKTIMTGDRVLAEKVSYYLRDPEPGDIVMFEDPDIPGRLLLKRCIAVGGQTVDINDEDGLVYVDGVALREPAHVHACQRRLLPLHGARRHDVDDGRQPNELARFALLRRRVRRVGGGAQRGGALALGRRGLAGIASRLSRREGFAR